VRAYSYDSSLGGKVLNGGDRRANTGVIGDSLSVKGDIDIATNKNTLSLKIGISKIFDGLLGLKFESWANSEGGYKGNETKKCVREKPRNYKRKIPTLVSCVSPFHKTNPSSRTYKQVRKQWRWWRQERKGQQRKPSLYCVFQDKIL
jgi:hypothetical protein